MSTQYLKVKFSNPKSLSFEQGWGVRIMVGSFIFIFKTSSMRKCLFFTLMVMLFYNCQQPKSDSDFIPVEINEIAAIIEAVILQDSLDVFETENGARMLCQDLIRVNIYVAPERKAGEHLPPPPPSFTTVSIQNLMYSKMHSDDFFSSKDSLFLLQQNFNPKILKISNHIDVKINWTSLNQELQKRENNERYNYYELSIPVFSAHRQKAYVILNHYCGYLCGSGQSIFLKRMNGKWIIIEQYRDWIS